MRRFATGLVILTALVGCSPSPAPTGALATPAGNPVASRSHGLGTSAPARVVMLIVGPPRAGQQFFSVDPGAPQTRSAVTAPAGRWTVVSAGGIVALSSTTNPAVVTLATVSGRSLVPTLAVELPAGDRWSGGYAACVSTDGSFLAADSGLAFTLHDSSGFREISGQRSNRGSCAWLNDRVAVWDTEDGSIAIWDRSSNRIANDPLAGATGRRLSSGGGLLSWVSRNDQLVVAHVTIDGGGATLGVEIGRVNGASVGDLSPDGRWIAVRYLDGSSAVIAITDTALGTKAPMSLSDDERIVWLAADQP
jgi:hypothetical protein